MFTFKKLRDQVYEVRFDEQREMCLSFLRYQEFYESPKFQGKNFTWAEFISWYCRERNKKGLFSYMKDWGGYNLPASVISEVHAGGIKDPNNYDALMLSLCNMMDDDSYLLGTYDDKHNSVIDAHEMTHAMYSIDLEYKNKCIDLISECEKTQDLVNILMKNDYAESSCYDEIQAYLTTSDEAYMKKIKMFNGVRKQAWFKELEKELRAIHKKHYAEFTKGIKL